MDYEALGRAIRARRKEAHCTQEKLAERAGISASFLGHIERGSRKASLETVISLANALGCGIDVLLAGQLNAAPGDYMIGMRLLSAVVSALREC